MLHSGCWESVSTGQGIGKRYTFVFHWEQSARLDSQSLWQRTPACNQELQSGSGLCTRQQLWRRMEGAFSTDGVFCSQTARSLSMAPASHQAAAGFSLPCSLTETSNRRTHSSCCHLSLTTHTLLVRADFDSCLCGLHFYSRGVVIHP